MSNQPTTPDPLEQSLTLATEHHLAGRLAEAEPIYRRIIAVREHPDALHRLGVLTWQNGNRQAAIDLIGRAVTLNPNEARYYCSRGQVLADLQVFDEAMAEFQRALQLKPKSAEALFGLGLALQATHRHDQAIAAYRRLLSDQPDHVSARNNLGNALQTVGDLAGAINAYRQALAVEPDHIESLNNLGGALKASGQLDAAVDCYTRAISLRADFAPLHANLGNALAARGQLDDGAAALQFAVQLAPDFAEGWYNLANVLRDLGQLPQALDAYRRALAIQPDYFDTLVNLGNVLQTRGEFKEASKVYLHALELRPDHATAHSNFSNALRLMGHADEAIAILRQALALRPDFHIACCNLGNVLKDTGRLDESLACYRRAIELKREDSISHSNLAYSVYFHPDYDAAAILRENLRFNVLHAQRLSHEIVPHANDADPNRRLRIGYVSPDFREHCQSMFTIPLLSNHDRANFEIFCYASIARPDEITQRIMTFADAWRPTTSLSDAQLAQTVRDDKIDILVDLTMHMSTGRPLLFARKPAPVQVAYLAYPGTTGLSAIDYRLTDPYLDPPGIHDCYYSERSIRLPDSFWCYNPLTTGLSPGPLPAMQRGIFTFGCLNNFCKVSDGTLDLWGRTISAVPGSRVLLLCPAGSHRQRVLDRLGAHGVDAGRIEFAAYRPRARYLELYRNIDLGLETFPYNGHTTSLDSVWMGVPVPTRIGVTAVGRAGWSQLCNLGLRELAAETDEQYVSIVLALARDLPRLAELRATLRQRLQSSPLMDAPQFARNLESVYRHLWQTWCASRTAANQ